MQTQSHSTIERKTDEDEERNLQTTNRLEKVGVLNYVSYSHVFEAAFLASVVLERNSLKGEQCCS